MPIDYLLLFIEGLLAFISPCFLPMIPIYLTYLVGNRPKDRRSLIINSVLFILGFTVVFVSLGLTASALGQFFITRQRLIQKIGGILLIIFGLNMIGVLKIEFLNRTIKIDSKQTHTGRFESFLFGLILAFGWSPCVGSFLGAALIKASSASTIFEGAFMLIIFSLGIGVPFFITALLFDSLTNVFNFVKKHYEKITLISGIFLIILGILMISNLFTKYLTIFH